MGEIEQSCNRTLFLAQVVAKKCCVEFAWNFHCDFVIGIGVLRARRPLAFLRALSRRAARQPRGPPARSPPARYQPPPPPAATNRAAVCTAHNYFNSFRTNYHTNLLLLRKSVPRVDENSGIILKLQFTYKD